MSRTVVMRDERAPGAIRSLIATIDEDGALQLSGQDLGGTEAVSADGEYEWFFTFPRTMLVDLLHVLEAPAHADVLDVIHARFRGEGSYEFERRVRESNLKPQLFVIS
jgi:hypothetical protein